MKGEDRSSALIITTGVFNGLCRYMVYCFVVVETTKSAKNILEAVIENIIFVGWVIQKDTYVRYVTFLVYTEPKSL